MKKKLFAITILTFIITSNIYGQFTFSASPGVNLNGAYMGYKVNDKIIPHIGVQYLFGKLNYNYTDAENITDKYDLSLNVIIPTIGLKYLAFSKNKLSGYFNCDLSKPLLTGKLTESNKSNNDYKDALDNVSIWGAQFGFGVEYFFDDNFSVGGEYGIRYYNLNYNDKNSGQKNNQESSYSDFGFILSPTYSKVSLNYYF